MSKSLEEITLEENDFLTHITKPIRKFHLIESDHQLKEMCQKLEEDNDYLAIDTERASGFKYFVCQIAASFPSGIHHFSCSQINIIPM